MLKIEEINKMDSIAIEKKISSIRAELFKIKMEQATSGIAKSHMKRELKKDVARLLTIKTQKGV